MYIGAAENRIAKPVVIVDDRERGKMLSGVGEPGCAGRPSLHGRRSGGAAHPGATISSNSFTAHSDLPQRSTAAQLQLAAIASMTNWMYSFRSTPRSYRVVAADLWHYELMSFGSHGKHRARSSSHDCFSHTAHDNVGQSSATVGGKHDQIHIVLASVLDDLHFR